MGKQENAKFVVGLGASAGGLEALESFFAGAPTDSGAAFVVVMHLSRDFKSMLDGLLASHTRMTVKAIENGETVQANTVYVIQPATTISMNRRKFVVETRPSIDFVGPVTTIDNFLESLALQWAENACGVILSGSGSDGADGIVAIKKTGGFTCAQTPETAKFDSMPLAAIETKAVRAIDSPEHLGVIIAESMSFPGKRNESVVMSDQETAFAKILQAIIGVSNIDATQYKHSMFERRVRKRMLHLRFGSLEDYAAFITDDLGEAQQLADMLLIGVTEFFRDETPFEILRKDIIPGLIRTAKSESRSVRVWVPGCATGQEAYSLAILFAEALRTTSTRLDVQIFATDLQKDFLSIAARGEFTKEQVKGIPNAYRTEYFTQSPETKLFSVDPYIRKMIVFAPHDVLADPPFTRLDLVSCRNMLIYFSVDAQQKILSGFAFGLNEKGTLLLGSSETVGAQREAFEIIDAKNRVFRRTPTRRVIPSYQAPVGKLEKENTRLGISRRFVKQREQALQPAYTALLNDFAPPSLLISGDRELLHCFGSARTYLRPPEGVAHFDVADMVDGSIRSPLIAGLERALKDKETITFSKIKTEAFPKPDMLLDIEVRPLFLETDRIAEHAIVIIDESPYVTQTVNTTGTKVISTKDLADERIIKLEAELERTREALQSTIEEIETTNEELQSSNEELMSSNEELQSTNEELSSVNEELYSVNAEYHRQNGELTQLSNDFDLLLLSTEIGVIFLDEKLAITRFTALARDIFNLTESDTDRSISNFRSPFGETRPDKIMEEALSKDQIIEKEVIDDDGVPWLLRAFAHKNGRGGVLTLINIGRLREAEIGSRRASQMLESIQKASRSFYLELGAKGLKIIQELGFSEYTGQKTKIISKAFDLKKIHKDDRIFFENMAEETLETEEYIFQARLQHGESESYRYINFIASRSGDKNLNLTGIDVDEFICSQKKAEEREAVLDAVLRASPSLISFVDKDEKYVYVNPAYEQQWNKGGGEIIGKTIKELLPKDAYKQAVPHIAGALKGKNQHYILDNVDEAGQSTKLSVTYEPVYDTSKKASGFVADVLDVTKFYAEAQALTGLQGAMGGAVKQFSYSVYVVDTQDLVIRYSNMNGMLRLGYDEHSDLKAGTKITRLTPTWGDEAWNDWLSKLKFGQDYAKHDLSVFSSSGNAGVADIHASLVKHDDQSLVVLRIFSDKEKAAALEDLKQRSQELAVSNRDLEQFASVIAHDLRAPLRHITQFSELVQTDIETENIEETQDYLEIIKGSAIKMNEMVDGLLSYSKIGTQLPDFTELTLKDCVDQAKKFLQESLEKSKAKIELEADINIQGDKMLMVRLFQNLIENSVKYKKAKAAPHIVITGSETDKGIEISICDNGIGMPKTASENIFKLFKRLHANDEYGGLGVGLASCKRIVELHNGTIYLDSGYEDGCRFVIELPRQPA